MQRTTLEGNGALDDEIMRLIEMQGGSANADLIKELIHTTLGLIEDGAGRGEIKILNAALREMRLSFQVFEPYAKRRKVSVFGSARTPVGAPEFEQARAFGRRMAELGYMVITGAGGGVMLGANEGAGRDDSFGCMISLPFEPSANEVIDQDAKLITYKYFFTRKLTFVKETDALVLFPGGFGTLDECFEALTLSQTGKTDPLPIVFLDIPGGDYWTSFERHVEEQLLRRGLIGADDRQLYHVAEDIEDAAQTILRFYSNYHSTRYVGEQTVVRHTEPVTEELVARLNDEYSDILVRDTIRTSGPLPEEANEPEIAHLNRLVMRFDRRSYGRFRSFIDAVNGARR